jgi:hypothetical protein
MSDIDFSIVLASRERVGLLENLLNSIHNTTNLKDRVEVLVGVDDDDQQTLHFTRRFELPMVRFVVRPRSEKLNEDYLNYLYRNFSRGRYLVVCNDDCLFSTPGWDDIARQRLGEYLADKRDGVVYAWFADSLLKREYGMNYCCFPLVSRRGADALGFMLHGLFYSWGADIAIWRVYNAVNRICDLSEIVIDHISHHSGKRERDELSHRVERISLKSEMDPAELDVSGDVARLKEYIERNNS